MCRQIFEFVINEKIIEIDKNKENHQLISAQKKINFNLS